MPILVLGTRLLGLLLTTYHILLATTTRHLLITTYYLLLTYWCTLMSMMPRLNIAYVARLCLAM